MKYSSLGHFVERTLFEIKRSQSLKKYGKKYRKTSTKKCANKNRFIIHDSSLKSKDFTIRKNMPKKYLVHTNAIR